MKQKKRLRFSHPVGGSADKLPQGVLVCSWCLAMDWRPIQGVFSIHVRVFLRQAPGSTGTRYSRY